MTALDLRCAAARNGNFDRETRYDTERAWRFVIALINMDDSAANDVLAQLGNCAGCLGGFGQILGALLSGVLIKRHGKENSIIVAQMMLDEVLSCPDLLDPGSDGAG